MTKECLKKIIKAGTSDLLCYNKGVYKIYDIERTNEELILNVEKTFKLINVENLEVMTKMTGFDKFNTLMIEHIFHVYIKDLCQMIEVKVYDCRLEGQYVQY